MEVQQYGCVTAMDVRLLKQWADALRGTDYEDLVQRMAQTLNARIDLQTLAVFGHTYTVSSEPASSLTMGMQGQTNEGEPWYPLGLVPLYPSKPVGFRQVCRLERFDTLRAEGKKLGEINAILEAEGFSEVSGEGVMPCPTKSHAIVRENKGARRLIETLPS